ncbi:MAG: alpha/beta hydrolase-fold protein [Pirellulales bacterium]|nr:alpha/beta hydrolase-fold protein [Pirellulales bacterium]
MRFSTVGPVLSVGFWMLAMLSSLGEGRLAHGQQPGAPRQRIAGPVVSAERQITFRLRADNASAVRVMSSDLPEIMTTGIMKKLENGVWETTVGPVPAGAYRYSFAVDGMTVLDERNTLTSQSNSNTNSLVLVPGKELFDTRDVPHGPVAQVLYHSRKLQTTRRMHVYTPPGYEAGNDSYPVLYLLHGATDSDQSWSSVGRAGIILDNLIAAGKAKPMVVIMPNGHIGPFQFGGSSFDEQLDGFLEDFQAEIRPAAEKRYRLLKDRNSRAIAGLSMGGAQSLDIAFANLDDFGYVGVFSSGIFGVGGGQGNERGKNWAMAHNAALTSETGKKGLKLLWFATGKEDFLLQTTRETVELFKKHGFEVQYQETDGGHTWLVWRDYLAEFMPLLFQ